MEIITAERKKLKKIINFLKKGKVIVCPTDTVYGLLCDATNEKAVEEIFKIKKRLRNKPLPVFVKDIKMAKKLAVINKKQEEILKEKWPGKFTFVFRRKKSRVFGVDRKTIALRVPDYILVNELLKKINKPLIGTSANISSKPAATKIKEVLKQLAKQSTRSDLVLFRLK